MGEAREKDAQERGGRVPKGFAAAAVAGAVAMAAGAAVVVALSFGPVPEVPAEASAGAAGVSQGAGAPEAAGAPAASMEDWDEDRCAEAAARFAAAAGTPYGDESRAAMAAEVAEGSVDGLCGNWADGTGVEGGLDLSWGITAGDDGGLRVVWQATRRSTGNPWAVATASWDAEEGRFEDGRVMRCAIIDGDVLDGDGSMAAQSHAYVESLGLDPDDEFSEQAGRDLERITDADRQEAGATRAADADRQAYLDRILGTSEGE
ncbi:hypothetical protein [Caniella muris]|uniref:hypothetical protein n=1 Tax=Caniella muris TaxID=2941502 RepID=UPI00203AA46D|nr:hypothetical protein [Caniella muris]